MTGTSVVAGGSQLISTRPSPAVSRMPWTGPGAGPAGGVGDGGGGDEGATVNVQVAFWSATATALPASSADSNTTCGQLNAVPVTQAGMSRMIWRPTSPVSSVSRWAGSRPMPTGQQRERRAIPEERVATDEHPTRGDTRDVVLAVCSEDQHRPHGVRREVLSQPAPSPPRSWCRSPMRWVSAGSSPCR